MHTGGFVLPLHCPLPEQSPGQIAVARLWSAHVSCCVPCAVCRVRVVSWWVTVRVAQSGPVQLASHRHSAGSTLESQRPRPLQFSSAPGHRTTEQSEPRQLSPHWQVPLTHVPCSLSVHSSGKPGHPGSSKTERACVCGGACAVVRVSDVRACAVVRVRVRVR
jgi:hypothetical protein